MKILFPIMTLGLLVISIGCGQSSVSGIRVMRSDKGRVNNLDIEAVKKAIDFWKPQRLGGTSYYICENNASNDAASNKTKIIFELMDINVQVAPAPLSEADKLNGIEWRGSVSLQYQAVRSYSQPDKSWSEWRGSGFAEPGLDFEKKFDGELKRATGQGFRLLFGWYHDRPIGETTWGTTTIYFANPKQVEPSELPK